MSRIFYTCQSCMEKVLYLERVQKNSQLMNVCSECAKGEEKHNPMYSRNIFPIALSVTEATFNNKTYTTLIDNHGHLIDSEDLLELADRLREYASISNIAEKTEEHNDRRFLDLYLGLKENNSGHFMIPNDFVAVSKREFNSEKRAWSFKCGNCSAKVGTKTDRYYYVLNLSHHQAMLDEMDRACSPECANVIAKDMIIRNMSKRYMKHIAPLDDFKVEIQ